MHSYVEKKSDLHLLGHGCGFPAQQYFVANLFVTLFTNFHQNRPRFVEDMTQFGLLLSLDMVYIVLMTMRSLAGLGDGSTHEMK